MSQPFLIRFAQPHAHDDSSVSLNYDVEKETLAGPQQYDLTTSESTYTRTDPTRDEATDRCRVRF